MPRRCRHTLQQRQQWKARQEHERCFATRYVACAAPAHCAYVRVDSKMLRCRTQAVAAYAPLDIVVREAVSRMLRAPTSPVFFFFFSFAVYYLMPLFHCLFFLRCGALDILCESLRTFQDTRHLYAHSLSSSYSLFSRWLSDQYWYYISISISRQYFHYFQTCLHFSLSFMHFPLCAWWCVHSFLHWLLSLLLYCHLSFFFFFILRSAFFFHHFVNTS